MSKNAKILVVGGVLAVGMLNAYAASSTACTTGTPTSIAGNAGSFVKDTFTPKCSGGVSLGYNDSATSMGVKAGSAKGMHTFGGGTEGGGVTQCESSSIANPHSSVTAQANGCV